MTLPLIIDTVAVLIILAAVCVFVWTGTIEINVGSKKSTPESINPRFHAPCIAPEWTLTEVVELRKFLGSPTGQMLLQRARSMEYNRAISNAKDIFHTQHSAGVTVGIADTLNWIESLASDAMFASLSQPSGDQDGKPNTANSEHDDAALVEKYSP